MSRLNKGLLKTGLPVFMALLMVTACSEMEDSNSPQAPTQQQQQPMMIELDPGVSVSNQVLTPLNKSFSTQELCSLTGLRIAYDMSHNTGRQGLTSPSGSNQNSILFGDYVSRGATITVITTFDLATLSNFDVLWLEEDFNNDLDASERALLETWVSNGGSVVILAEDWAGASPLIPLGYSYVGSAGGSSSTNLNTHPLTEGVTTIQFSGTGIGLGEPVGATWILKNSAGTGTFISAREYGAGKVVVLADEFLINGTVGLADNRVLGNNIMSWLFTRPVGIDIKPGGYPNSINCSSNGNGVITVAILTTSTFDALDVDHTTVRFEGASERHTHQGSLTRHEQDVDNDGDLDLVFHFQYNQTTLSCSSTTGTLTGNTFCGQAISGWDTVNMVP